MNSLLHSYNTKYISPSINPYVRERREQGRGVVGYLCNAPKEMIYAAGLFPIRLLGNTDPIKDAYAYFPTVFCNYSRSLMELGIKGAYNQLSGIVSVNMCDTIVHLSNAMQTAIDIPYFYFINRPHDTGMPAAYNFFRQEIHKFKEFLEKLTGESITQESLIRAIHIYNENRALLKELYALRGKEPTPLLSGTEVNTLTYISQVVPPEVNTQLLSEIIKSVRAQYKTTESRKPRIHVSGSISQDLALFSLIEECGGMVVSDDLCSGLRLFWDPIPETENPLDVLTNYYLEKMPCPVMHTKGVENQRLKDIIQIMQEYKADGVIFCLQKYCDSHQFDLPYLIFHLKEAGIPVLSLEVEGAISPEQLRTRLQAFIEVLG